MRNLKHDLFKIIDFCDPNAGRTKGRLMEAKLTEGTVYGAIHYTNRRDGFKNTVSFDRGFIEIVNNDPKIERSKYRILWSSLPFVLWNILKK